MKKFLIVFCLSVLAILPSYSMDEIDSTKFTTPAYIKGGVPTGDEEILNSVREKFKKMDTDIDLLYSFHGNLPFLLSNEFDLPAYDLEQAYGRYRFAEGTGRNKILDSEKKSILNYQTKIKSIYQEIVDHPSNKRYLVLLCILNKDTGFKTTKEKGIIVVNLDNPDKDIKLKRIDKEYRQEVAIILTSINGIAFEFLQSKKDLQVLASASNDEMIKFILEPLEN